MFTVACSVRSTQADLITTLLTLLPRSRYILVERWKKTALYEVVTKYTSIPDRSYPLLLTLTVRCRYFAVVFCQGNTCIQRISPLVLQSTHRKREKETERERESRQACVLLKVLLSAVLYTTLPPACTAIAT